MIIDLIYMILDLIYTILDLVYDFWYNSHIFTIMAERIFFTIAYIYLSLYIIL